MTRIGLQLWTIREECERDLEGALRRIGAQGYEGVELFHLHGHESTRVRAWLDEAGLAAAGRHARLEALEDELPQLAAELEILGSDRIAISWIDPALLGQPQALVARIESAARAARDAGLRLGFHNHWDEVTPLDGGSSFLDLLRELPHELLWLELDLGWIWHAGGDPVSELQATSGRCPLVHVKDYRSREGRDDVPVGDGSVGYERVLPVALTAGVEWLVVEEDEVEGDPFAAVERSLQGVHRILAAA
ncbi:MAG TPA: sugar phosphate isomerase/epimerase [Gaiellaceae bacterium]